MLNSISMVGRLTRDPELRQTKDGKAWGTFTIACDDGRKGPNGEKQVIFMDCAAFGGMADTLAKFFHKGNLIGVVGRLTSRKYENKEGVTVTAYQILCDHIEFVESTAQMNAAAEATGTPQTISTPTIENPAKSEPDIVPDDLPF